MLMLICIKQYLSNIWSSIHEKVEQHWAWVEKKGCLKKKLVFHDLLCQKLFVSWLKSNPYTFQIQNVLSFNNDKQEFIENNLRKPDRYLHKILLLFRKFSVWLRISLSISFEESGKSETGQ